jgi:hypothetical protein
MPDTLTDRIARSICNTLDGQPDDARRPDPSATPTPVEPPCRDCCAAACSVVALLTAEGRLLSESQVRERREVAEAVAEYNAKVAAMKPEELHSDRMHPGYEYATTVGQRKHWDDAEVPPDGDGWVRNVNTGRGGWNRFDHTEESYWMRPKPTVTEEPADV